MTYDPFNDFGISCGYCGHVGTMESFANTEIGGRLPDHIWQCPKCMTAWSVKTEEEYQSDWDHWYSIPSNAKEPTRIRQEATAI